MAKKKKMIIFLVGVIVLLVIGVAISTVLDNVKKTGEKENKDNGAIEKVQTSQDGEEKTVTVYGWCDELYEVCNIQNDEEDEMRVGGVRWATGFSSEKSLDELLASNKDYVCDFNFFMYDKLVNAKLLCDGTNYVAVFPTEEDNSYCVIDCVATINADYTQELFFPCPVYTNIYYGFLTDETVNDPNFNSVNYLYGHITFEEACEFYERLSEEYVVIDKEKQTITVDAYYSYEEKILDKYVTLDWKNKTYTYDDIETGEHIVFDGYPKKEAPLTKTISAGSWNGNEQDFDLLKIHEVDTVEYNNEGLEIAADMFKSSDKYPAVADGVEEIEDTDYYPYDYKDNPGKLIFVKNNYYIMYYKDSKEKYIISNCCGMVDMNNDDTKELLESMSNQSEQKEDILFPMPGRLVLSDFGDKDVKEHGYYAVENFFDRIDFKYASEFYGRFTNDCADIDKDNQTITVDGYDRADDEYIEDFITIDWKNKTFTYTDPGSGEKIVYDGSVCK